MKNLKINYLLIALTATILISSCRKDNIIPDPIDIKPVRKGLYILAEGGFNANNSLLSYYDYETKVLVDDQFKAANGRGLGDTGNDAQVYNNKLYVIVNVSSTVEILDPVTAKSIKQISLKNGSVDRQPRYIVFNKNLAFISCYDGTIAVLNTETLLIEKYITVGSNPEQMAISNGKLYVANSGGLNYPNYDKTVSVVDLTTLTEIKKITVTENPRGVVADKYGDIYVLSTGNYGSVKPAMAIIDSKTDLVTKTFDNFSAGSISIAGDIAYLTASKAIKVFNVKTETLEKDNFITDGTVITTVYGVKADEVTGEVFVTDAKNYVSNGELFCFDEKGVKKYSLKAGVNPNG
ncbi:MAG: YncE family protein, partial [Pedobacter sp.]